MSFRTVMIERPCKLSYSGGFMQVRFEDGVKKILLAEINSVLLATTQIYVSARLASELAKAKISLVVCDEKFLPIGQYLPLYGAHNCAKRIQEQLAWGDVPKKQVWQTIVKHKIIQQARLLHDRGKTSEKMLFAFSKDVKSGDSTNREAAAARIYFASLFGENFSRDIENSINASLNYGYSILMSMVAREISLKGYLTQVGIFHRNEYNQFNLACDLMEPFRPFVDRVVFDNDSGNFSRDMRKLLTSIPTMTVQYKDGEYKFSSVVAFYVQDCFNALNKKITAEDIIDFKVAEDGF